MIGTALTSSAFKLMLLGSGELGKEVAIEAQRLGLEVIAVDRYANAPAMQVAHRAHVVNMLDGAALRALIEAERPDVVVPELEAIHTPTLEEMEIDGLVVIPTARAARLTMDREGIRRLAAETLGLPTSPYRFCDDEPSYRDAIATLGLPCVVKPLMSSSGKGQSIVRTALDIDAAWQYAQAGGRAGAGRVIVEGFVPFDFEITLLTVRHQGGTTFCEMATIGSRGNLSRWRPRRSGKRKPSRTKSPTRSEGADCSVSSCLYAAMRCCSPKSRPARTTLDWLR